MKTVLKYAQMGRGGACKNSIDVYEHGVDISAPSLCPPKLKNLLLSGIFFAFHGHVSESRLPNPFFCLSVYTCARMEKSHSCWPGNVDL